MKPQNKKTLLVLASTFPRWHDDKEPRFVYDLCQGLKDTFNVIVLTSHFHGASSYEELNGLIIIRYRYAPAHFEKLVYNGGITTNLKNNKLKWLLVPLFFVSQFYSILKLLRQYPISIIHAHWLIPQGFLALLAIKSVNKSPKLICTSHGGDLFGLNDPLSIKIKQWVLSKTDAITVVSSAMQTKVLQLTSDAEDKLSVIPMGTDLKTIFSRNPEITRESNLIIFAGRLVEKKGVDTLINALQEIQKKYSSIKLVIIGDGPEKEQLEALSRKLSLHQIIQFTGKLSHNDLAKWYLKATLAIFPFKEAKNKDIEGLGLVIIEALGCECPVIVGDVPAVHDIITHNKTGLLFKSDATMELAKKTIYLLSNPLESRKLAIAGHKFVLDNFGQNQTSIKYKNLIQQTLSIDI